MKETLYKMIYKDIKESILDSTLAVGTQLPTDQELTKKYDVSTITIKNAMDLLKEDGLISRKPRKGTYVIKDKLNEKDTFNKNAFVKSKPLIGLVVDKFNEFFGLEIIKTIIEYKSNDMNVIFKITDGNTDEEEAIISELLDANVDGILLMPSSSEYYSAQLLELASSNFPVVLIDRVMDKLPVCSVTIDNHLATENLIEHLFDNGHKCIGIMTGKTNISTNEKRIDAAIKTHVKHHISINQSQILTNINISEAKTDMKVRQKYKKNIQQFLFENKKVTAIFAAEFAVAVLVKEAIEELDKNVYKDYSIVCFDHNPIPRADNNSFLYNHIIQDQKAIGKLAVDLIFDKIDNPTLVKHLKAPYDLVMGMSVKNLNKM